MSSTVDIKQLAVERASAPATSKKRRGPLLTRYVIPGVLVLGFALLMAWAARDFIWPPQSVWVVPVLASQSAAQQEGVPLFQAAGWIEPRPSLIRVAALAQGVIERLLVVQDQHVKAGEPIADLVKDDARLAYELAAATLKLREAALKEAKAALTAATTRLENPVHLKALLGEAEAALAQVATEQQNLPFESRRAEAQLTFAKKDYEGKVAAANAVSGRAIEEARSVLDASEATSDGLMNRAGSLAKQEAALVSRRDALRAQLELLVDEKQARAQGEARVEGAEARVAQTQIALEEAELRLNRMTVRAPVDGRIYQLIAFPGTTLTGGMGTLTIGDGSTVVTMYQPDSLQVRVDVRFEDIPKVSLGQPVLINNPVLSEPLTGRVLFVSSEANIQKNTLQVKVEIDSAESAFKPEMLVDVTFLAPKRDESTTELVESTRLYLPQRVIQRDEVGSFVWLADQSEGLAHKIAVTTGGALAGGLVEVTQGLAVGSRVIARGHEGLREGQRIEIFSEEAGLDAAAPTTGLPKEGA